MSGADTSGQYGEDRPGLRSRVGSTSAATANTKADQIVQHFFAKTVAVVSQARTTPLPNASLGSTAVPPGSLPAGDLSASASGSSTPLRAGTSRSNSGTAAAGSTTQRRTNKWFNLELPDTLTDPYRSELKTWRAVSSAATSASSPAMLLSVLLDTSSSSFDFTPAQQTTRARSERAVPRKLPRKYHAVELERWTLQLQPLSSPPSASSPVPDSNTATATATELPAVYKHAIVHFRAMYALARNLPAWTLLEESSKDEPRRNMAPLRMGCRVSVGKRAQDEVEGELAVDVDVPNQGESVSVASGPLHETIAFPEVVTPVGTLILSCTYRLTADFSPEPAASSHTAATTQSLLSSRYIDEDFFKPTLARYNQQQQRQRDNQQQPAPSSGLALALARGDAAPIPIVRHSSAAAAASAAARVPLPGTSPISGGVSPSSGGGTGGRYSVSAMGSVGVGTNARDLGVGNGDVVEPAFVSLSRARGASYRSANQQQQPQPGLSTSSSSTSSRRMSLGHLVGTGTSPSSSSPIFRASSYTNPSPLLLGTSPSGGPPRIQRAASSSTSVPAAGPSSIGLGFARRQQSISGDASTPPPTSLLSQGAPPSAPRPIPTPTSGTSPSSMPISHSRPQYYGSYSRSSLSGGSGSVSRSGGQEPASWGTAAANAPSSSLPYYRGSLGRIGSYGRVEHQAVSSTPPVVEERDTKRFLDDRIDDSSDINDFLGLIDSRPDLRGAAAASSTSAASSTAAGLGASMLTSKAQVEEQLKALRGSVYGSSSALPGSGPFSRTSATATTTGLRRQASRLSIEEESTTGTTSTGGQPAGAPASRIVRAPRTTTSSVSPVLPSYSTTATGQRVTPSPPTQAQHQPQAISRFAPPPSTTSSSASSSPAVAAPMFPPYVSRSRAPVTNVTTGFEIQRTDSRDMRQQHPLSIGVGSGVEQGSGTGNSSVTSFNTTGGGAGGEGSASVSSVEQTRSAYDEETVGRLELSDEEEDDAATRREDGPSDEERGRRWRAVNEVVPSAISPTQAAAGHGHNRDRTPRAATTFVHTGTDARRPKSESRSKAVAAAHTSEDYFSARRRSLSQDSGGSSVHRSPPEMPW